MKKLSILLIILFALSTSYAFATPMWTGAVSDGAGNWTPDTVTDFDWSSAGSGMAQGLGTSFAVGDTFNFLYQAKLTGLSAGVGNPVALPGDPLTYEYTIVATLPEKVFSISAGGPPTTATFLSEAGGTFSIFYDSNPNSDVPTGFGFDDGTKVMSGTFGAGQVSSFTATVPGAAGIGSFYLEGLVTDLPDADFLNPDWIGPLQWIVDIELQGTLNQPPGNSTTTQFFDGRAGEGSYATVPFVSGSDTLFKNDASNTLSVVPEPSTVILMGIGLLGLAGYGRKRIKK